MADPVYYVDPNGQTVELPAEQAASAERLGYAPASPEQAAAFHAADERARTYGTPGQAALAGSEAALRALTFGGSTVLARAMGVPAEDIAARAEENPVAEGVGTAVGIAGPTLLSGGLAGAAEGSAAAATRGAAEMTAPALVSRLGHGITEALGGGAGRELGVAVPGLLPQATGLVGRALRQAVATGAGSAVEGAFYDAGNVVHEAALGDPNLTAENALSEIGLSAALGGGIGAGLGIAEIGGGAALLKARESTNRVLATFAEKYPAFAAKATGASEEEVQHLLANRARLAAGASLDDIMGELRPKLVEPSDFVKRDLPPEAIYTPGEVPPEAIYTKTERPAETVFRPGEAPKRPDLPALTPPVEPAVVAKEMADALEAQTSANREVLREAGGVIRPAETAELVSGADPSVAASEAVRLAGEVDALARKFRTAGPDLYDQGTARRLEDIRDGLLRDVAPSVSPMALGAGDAGAARTSATFAAGSRETRVVTPQRPRGEPARYEVVEADSLVPSHDPHTFQPSSKYPAGVQERPYHAQAEGQNKIIKGAQRLDPALVLSDTPTAVDGPPIVTGGDRHLVLGGNGRTMMMQRAFKNPEAANAYRDALAQKAPVFGIKPEEVAALKRPVLVRVVSGVSDAAPASDLVSAVRRYNEGLTEGMSPIARAVADGKSMSPRTVEAIGEVLSGAGDASLRDVLREKPRDLLEILKRDGIINDTNRAEFVAGDALTNEAKDRIEGMFLGRLMGTADRYSATPPAIARKMERVVQYVAKVGSINPALDETGTVRAALDLLNDAHRRGVTLRDLLAQGSLLGEEGADAGARALAQIIDGSNGNELAARFRDWAKHAAVDPRQEMMFAKPPTPASARRVLFSGSAMAEKAAAAPIAAVTDAAAPAFARVVEETAAAPAALPTNTPRVPQADEIFRRIDETKRLIFEETKIGLAASRRDILSARAVGEIHQSFKNALENEDVWGPAAVRQHAYNAAFSEFKTAEKEFNRYFATKVPTKGGGFVYRPDPAKIEAVLKGIDDQKNSLKVDAFRRYQTASRALHDEIDRSASTAASSVEDLKFQRPATEALFSRTDSVFSAAKERSAAEQVFDRATAEQKLQLRKYRDEMEAFKGTEAERRKLAAKMFEEFTAAEKVRKAEAGAAKTAFEKAEDARRAEAEAAKKEFKVAEEARKAESKAAHEAFGADAKAQAAELKRSVRDMKGTARWNGFMDIIGAGASGANPLLSPFFVGYRAMKYLSSPDKTARVLAALERTNQKVAARLDALASTLVRAGPKAANIGAGEAAAGIGKLFGKAPQEAAATFAQQVNQLNQLGGDPAQMQAALEKMTGDVHDHAPDTAQAAQIAAVRGVAFLKSKIPQPTHLGPLVKPLPPSPAEVARFHRYLEVVQNPESVLKQAAAGTLTHEAVEAAKAVYPQMYDRMCAAVFAKLADHGPPPYRQLQQLSLLLGTDLDGSAATIAANQAVSASAAAQEKAPMGGPPGAGKLTMAQRTQTTTQRIASR